ncbi:hypothetical protein PJP07_30835 [Mycobacterium kansasii]
MHSLHPRSIGRWNDMTREFTKKFFSYHKEKKTPSESQS